jgi:hypothetical protein
LALNNRAIRCGHSRCDGIVFQVGYHRPAHFSFDFFHTAEVYFTLIVVSFYFRSMADDVDHDVYAAHSEPSPRRIAHLPAPVTVFNSLKNKVVDP